MDFNSLSMLVVEDQAVQRKVAVHMLQSIGVGTIAEARDGDAALQCLSVGAPAPDVILCDINMPGMDGIEFIRHLGEARRTSALVLASGLDPTLLGAAEAVAQAHGLHVLGTLEKPLTPEKLYDVLRHHTAPHERHDWRLELKLEREELEEAIADRQIVAVFQPRIGVADARIAGAEALARWCHPDRGTIAPGVFIPFSEECGLIDALTWVMLEQAMQEALEWKRSGEDWAVSVNLSLHYLGYHGVADRIAALAERYGLEPGRIVLEVTESLAATKLAAVIGNLARLRLKGFGVSIDDYGTGYASLEQLSRIPFTELKVDRGFVHGASSKSMLRAILGSSVELARRLKLHSVAEGVETSADLALLADLGCDYAQGFHIARPMPAQEFLDWTERWQR